jgi:hypothetical protein
MNIIEKISRFFLIIWSIFTIITTFTVFNCEIASLGSDFEGGSDHFGLKPFIDVSSLIVKKFITIGYTGKTIAMIIKVDSFS